MESNWHIGDIASLPKHGDVVIADIRAVTRGRQAGKAEYWLASLAPEGFPGRVYAVRARIEALNPAKGLYTADEIQAAIERFTETKMGVMDQKAETKERCRTAIDLHNIRAGMIVDIRYRTGIRPEHCEGVNVRSGTVGIKVHGRSKPRWIPARFVAGAHTMPRPLGAPVSAHINASALDALLTDGWAHLRIRRDGHIASSYVVAFDPVSAERGTNYDGASAIVYHDTKLNLYWRATGSLD